MASLYNLARMTTATTGTGTITLGSAVGGFRTFAEAGATDGQTVSYRVQVQALEAQIKPLNAEIKAIETPLYGIDMERAALARSLGGKTGTPGA